MDYKKRYEEALERAKEVNDRNLLIEEGTISEYIFPELKESEDEKNIKNLINE